MTTPIEIKDRQPDTVVVTIADTSGPSCIEMVNAEKEAFRQQKLRKRQPKMSVFYPNVMTTAAVSLVAKNRRKGGKQRMMAAIHKAIVLKGAQHVQRSPFQQMVDNHAAAINDGKGVPEGAS